MNILATRTTAVFAAMTAVIILAFAMVMTVSAQAAPERPTDLTATATDHDTVSLSWSHPNPASVDHYQVFSRRADSGTGIAQVGTSTTTSFLHNGLEPESTYIYRVRPVNCRGRRGTALSTRRGHHAGGGNTGTAPAERRAGAGQHRPLQPQRAGQQYRPSQQRIFPGSFQL